MSSILDVNNLSFSYQDGPLILENISFQLDSGETLGVIGPNGAGKTTLLKLMVGLLTPTSGEINMFGKSLKGPGDFPRDLISYVPQVSKTNDALPISIKNLLDFSQISAPVKIDRESALKTVGLDKDIHELVGHLSGGEKQRVLLAKALMKAPKLLILDEPTQGLDTKGQDQLLTLIEKIKQDFDTAILLVDHNIGQLMKFCDKILCLNRTFHWHDRKDLMNKDILEKTYHCEFEHLLIHEKGDINADGSGHEECDHHHDAHEHQSKKEHHHD